MTIFYCGHCGDREAPCYRCDSCNIMLYCSKECQDEDR